MSVSPVSITINATVTGQQSVNALAQALQQLGVSANSLAASNLGAVLTAIGNNAAAAAISMRGLALPVATLANSGQAAGVQTIATALANVGTSAGHAAGQVNTLAQSLLQAGAAGSGLTAIASAIVNIGNKAAGAKGSAASLLDTLKGYAAAALSIHEVERAFEALNKTAEDNQQIENTFKFATNGDAAKAAQEIQFVRRESDRTGQSFSALAHEYGQLLVAAKGTNMEGKATRDLFSAISERLTITGASASSARLALKAFTELISKGKIELKEMQNQLGNDMPGAMQVMAKALGITNEKLHEMLKTGTLTSEALKNWAVQSLSETEPQIAQAADGYIAHVNRMGNAWFDFKTDILNAGVEDSMKSVMDKVTQALRDPNVRGAMTAIGSGLAEVLAWCVDAFSTAATYLNRAAINLGAGLAGLWTGIKYSFLGILPDMQNGWYNMLASLESGLASFLQKFANGIKDMPGLGGLASSLEGKASSLRVNAAGNSMRSAKAKLDFANLETQAYATHAGISAYRDQKLAESGTPVSKTRSSAPSPDTPPDPKSLFQPKGKGKGRGSHESADADFKADLAAERTELQAHYEVLKADLEKSLEERHLTQKGYIERKRDLDLQQFEDQKRLLEREKAAAEAALAKPGVTPADRQRLTNEIKKINADIKATLDKEQVVRIKAEIDVDKLNESLTRLKASLEAETFELKGLNLDAQITKINEERRQRLNDPLIRGDAGLEKQVNDNADLKAQNARFENLKTQAERAVQDAKSDIEDLQRQQQEGLLTSAEVAQKTRDINGEAAAGIKSQIDAMRALVNDSPKMLKELDRLQSKYKDLSVQVGEFGRLVGDSVSRGFQDGIKSLHDGKGVGDVLKSMLRTVAQDIENDGAKKIGDAISKGIQSALGADTNSLTDMVTNLFKKVLGGLGGGSSGGAGVGGVVSNLLGSGGGGWGGLWSSIAGAFGFAEGGIVEGPGTETSDSIPVKLSRGEGVLTAKAVRMLGVDAVHAINARARGYATGGIVGGENSSGVLPGVGGGAQSRQQQELHVHLENVLDPTAMVQRADSAVLHRIVLDAASTHPTAMRQALGLTH